jgi:hypothetical protein
MGQERLSASLKRSDAMCPYVPAGRSRQKSKPPMKFAPHYHLMGQAKRGGVSCLSAEWFGRVLAWPSERSRPRGECGHGHPLVLVAFIRSGGSSLPVTAALSRIALLEVLNKAPIYAIEC